MIGLLFKSTKTDHRYPLMRDPKRDPRCYEMTEQERLEAIQQLDKMLKYNKDTTRHD